MTYWLDIRDLYRSKFTFSWNASGTDSLEEMIYVLLNASETVINVVVLSEQHVSLHSVGIDHFRRSIQMIISIHVLPIIIFNLSKLNTN